MKTKRKLSRLLLTTIFAASLFSPVKALNAEQPTRRWEISGGYVNRQVGEVEFKGPIDLQNVDLNLEEFPLGTIGGVRDDHFIDEMGNNTWLRRYAGFTEEGFEDDRARIVDNFPSDNPDGITDGHRGGEVYDGTIRFKADELSVSAESSSTSGERSADLGNASGYMVGVRRNLNDIFSLALEFKGGFNFDGESSSSASSSLRYTLDEIADTYQLLEGNAVNMNEFQRERRRTEEGELASIKSYVNEKADVDLNTVSLVGRVGKTIKNKLRLEGLLGFDLNIAKMSVQRDEKVAVTSSDPEIQQLLNEAGLQGYERSTSESDTKVVPGLAVGGGVAYRLVKGKKVDIDVGVDGQYHWAFDNISAGNAEAKLNGYSVTGKVTLRFF